MAEQAERKTELVELQHQENLLETIVRELEERRREPQIETFKGLTLQDVEGAINVIEKLQDASLRLTHPQDWVFFGRAEDPIKVYFLQDVGCQRIKDLWGITFDALNLRRDTDAQELPDKSYVVEVAVRATSALTGGTVEEIGFRSSTGLFARDWQKAVDDENHVEKARLKANVRKAALANGRGRCIRTITGTAQMPHERLAKRFTDEQMKLIRSADFQAGTKGGAGNYATDAQLAFIGREAGKKVAGLQQAIEFDRLVEKLSVASLTGGRTGTASALIDKLKNAKPNSWTVAQLEKELGVRLVEGGGGDGN